MAEILFIKTSSLGDVIHHMPALTEARKARPDARFAWLVEEAFAPLVRLHPAVDEVIPVAWRRWRKSFYAPATLVQIAENLRSIRARRYDDIVDSQGLLRSAIIGRFARRRRARRGGRRIAGAAAQGWGARGPARRWRCPPRRGPGRNGRRRIGSRSA